MTHDAAIPSGLRPAAITSAEHRGVIFESARWTPDSLAWLARKIVTEGHTALARLPADAILEAWSDTVEVFRDPSSAVRRELNRPLERFCRLSPSGLAAGLEAVLGGVRGGPLRELGTRADQWRRQHREGSLVLVILAANLPALAVQPLLPALLLRRPVILKSPSAEPLFAPAFVRALTERLPEARPALAALTWKGGNRALEAPLLEAAGRILAYGDDESIEDLERRAPTKVFAYGAKISLAILGSEIDANAMAPGLARDIALFDQRGCLSLHGIFTSGEPMALATALAQELVRLASEWPPGPLDPVAAAGVHQIRSEATMRGLVQPELPIGVGTVVVEPLARFLPSPGLRTVRVHPVSSLAVMPEILAGWSGRLQGAALAGEEAWQLEEALHELGVSRCAPPGELQTPDATWHNGGVHPFTALTGSYDL